VPDNRPALADHALLDSEAIMKIGLVVATVVVSCAALGACGSAEGNGADALSEAASIREALAEDESFCRIYAADGTIHDYSIIPSPTQPYCVVMETDVAEPGVEVFPSVAAPGEAYCRIPVEHTPKNPPREKHCHIVSPSE
jgi:hypothetical protein